MKKFLFALLALAVMSRTALAGDVLVVLKNPSAGGKISAASLAADGEHGSYAASVASSINAEVDETYKTLSEMDGKIFIRVTSAAKTTEELLSELRANPNVIAVSPNYSVITPNPERHIELHEKSLKTAEVTPNDVSFDQIWGIKKIRAPEAWEITTGSREIYVAVMDTGTCLHSDLIDNTASELGIAFEEGQVWSKDVHGHGTHVSGTIGAVGNNDICVTGINWRVSLIPVNVCNTEGTWESYDAIMAGMDYLVSLLQARPDMKLAAVNMSWGRYDSMTPEESKNTPLYLAFKVLDNMNRTLMIVAAGNDGLNVNEPTPFDNPMSTSQDLNFYSKGQYSYPVCFPDLNNMIVVGAVASDDTAAYFTCWGDSVDIAAPGVDILSTFPEYVDDRDKVTLSDGTSAAIWSGTSMAAPHVVGAAALLMSAYPNATPAQIKKAILNGANREINPLVRPFYEIYTTRPKWSSLREYFERFYEADRVGRTGLLDVKKSLELLAAEFSSSSSSSLSSTSSGCDSLTGTGAVLFGIMGLIMLGAVMLKKFKQYIKL